MKTNIIRIATVTLVVTLTISASAQKSVNENTFTHKLGSLVKENLKSASQELASQINNIKSAIQYKPQADFEYESVALKTNVIDLSELESIVKFSPCDTFSESVVTEDNITASLEELKLAAKYQPVSIENEI